MSQHTQACLECVDHTATVTLRSEHGVNVASVEFMRELEAVVDEITDNTAVRFVIFQAQGKVFLAGADIKAMQRYNIGEARAMAELGHRVFDKIEALPHVTVASIQGAALGGGCELALACDFRIAVKTAPLGQPEALLGLIPGWGGTERLPKLIPLSAAKRLLFTGESIKAEEAKSIGLVDEIVNSAEDLDPYIRAFIGKMIKAGPAATAGIKDALLRGKEIERFAECFNRKESAEGMTAFLDKRPANWTS